MILRRLLPLAIAAVIVIVIGAIVAGIWIIVDSLKDVPLQQYGIDYSSYTGTLNTEKVYTNGKHFVGPGHRFFLFPQQAKTYEIKGIKARTGDGIPVTMDITYQLQLQQATLIKVFLKYGLGYELAVMNIIQHQLRNGISIYTAGDITLNRAGVSATLGNMTASAIAQEKMTLSGVQFPVFSFPKEYDTITQTNSEVAQLLAEATSQLDVTRTRTNTKVLTENNNAAVLYLRAQGAEEGKVLGQTKTVQGEFQKLTAQADAYQRFAKALDLDPEQLMAYLWIESLKAGDAASKFINMERPAGVWTVPSVDHKDNK